MQEAIFRNSDLDRLLNGWDALLKEFPEMKRELLEDLGRQMLAEVRSRIGGSGEVQEWQDWSVGSKNGYAAARPKAKTYKTTKGGKRYAVGYVTNAIENGHRHRRPRPTGDPGYHYTRNRIKCAAAAGKHFYAGVRRQLDRMGQAEVQRLAAEIARRLEGNL